MSLDETVQSADESEAREAVHDVQPTIAEEPGITNAELLMEFYHDLHSETRGIIDQSQKRLTGGIGSIAAILGYTFIANEPRLIALIPLIYALLIVVDLEATVTLALLGCRLSEIEDELADHHDKLRWQSEFGLLASGRTIRFFGIDVNNVYFGFVVVLVAVGYLACIAIGLEVWSTIEPTARTLHGVEVTVDALGIAYAGLTLGVLAAVEVTRRHIKTLESDWPVPG